MILSNKNIGGNDGVNINELKSAVSFFRSRLMEIESKTIELARRKLSLQTKFIEIAKQLLELNSKSNMQTGIVKVIVSAKSERTYLFDLNILLRCRLGA